MRDVYIVKSAAKYEIRNCLTVNAGLGSVWFKGGKKWDNSDMAKKSTNNSKWSFLTEV
jgi:hypothetical protein